MAMKDPNFPNWHRVLNQKGGVPSGWKDERAAGPEACRRRLEAEGIQLQEDGTADPAQRVGPDELTKRRAESA
jgi:alkylated DNA nucleotide flippase Atl1